MNNLYIIKKTKDYELLDTGGGEKLERFGNFTVSRPDPQAIWQKKLSLSDWKKADAVFEQKEGKGKWRFNKPFPEKWQINLVENNFLLKKTIFKHLGIFPEQLVNWQWLYEKIKKETDDGQKVSVLNLFAYTGGATLSCAKAGAEVCHIDSSDFSIEMAKENRDISGLGEKPIRFIMDDVKKFVEKEIRRGKKYDVIILDPPVYGKGIKNEVWNLESDLLPFILKLSKILSNKPLAILLNGYASSYSHIAYKQVLETITSRLGGHFYSGELLIEENSGRFLPSGIFARWEK